MLLNNFKRGSGWLRLTIVVIVFLSITDVLELEIVPRGREDHHHTLLGVDAVLVHHVAQVALAGGQQVVGARHEPGVLAPDM